MGTSETKNIHFRLYCLVWVQLFFLTGGCVANFARAADKRPAFSSSRYQEDYRFLRDPSRRTDIFDPLKYFPLNDSESIVLTLGGETRQHFEFIENNNWGAGAQDNNGYYLQRYLGHADLHLGKRLRLFGQVMSGILSGRRGGPRGVDKDPFDLNQGFVDLDLLSDTQQALTVRAGRQEIIFGSRRFFNYRERPNMRLSHDAVMGIFNSGKWDIRAFGARPVNLSPDYFDNQSSNNNTVWGLYAVRDKLPLSIPVSMDVYYLGLNGFSTYDQGTAEELRHVIGTRLWGQWKAIDYNFEFMYQFGTFGARDIQAYVLASDTGYTVRFNGSRKVRLSLRADLYSGDKNPADGTLNSFNPFFPKGKHISQLAATGLINQRDLHPRITMTLTEHWSFTTSAEFIWRDSLNDGIYSIGNGLLVSGRTSRARYVGTQPEMEVKYTFNRHVDLKGIFVHFIAGEFLKQTTPGKNITYLGSMLTFRF
ncbi:MAG: alginate export family protein [Candidatus Nitronauta litoralis]|uniref:Alginate export family protein n=1 Tax=Candidatus Nitronauta litoralis TaxID=2705533 RepID=A0A7T0BXR5_9BACT|nr:MAG: alginate export family protein [Candidatus Nitronauta litoralis]